jgi:hypothetical protein
VSQTVSHAPLVTVAMVRPSMAKITDVTAMLSDADALIVIWPRTVRQLPGDVIVRVGRVVSAG